MHRSRPGLFVALALSLPILAAVACSSAPEQPILDAFFAASRLRDRSSLDTFATTIFEPGTDGTVLSFSITSVGPERRGPIERDRREATDTPGGESRVVQLSVAAPGAAPIDVSRRDGDLVARDVTVSARLRQPDGRTVSKTLVVTLEKAELKGSPAPADARWVVTAVKAQGL